MGVMGDVFNHALHGFHVFAVDEVEFVGEVIKVLETSIDVCLSAKGLHFFPVGMVNVSVHPKHSAQNFLGSGKEVLSKIRGIFGENCLIV